MGRWDRHDRAARRVGDADHAVHVAVPAGLLARDRADDDHLVACAGAEDGELGR